MAAQPLILVWPHAAAFWLVLATVLFAEWRLVRREHASETTDDGRARPRVRPIVISGWVAFALGLVAALDLPTARMRHGHVTMFVVGLLMLAAGGLLRWHCRHVLGALFTTSVRVAADQPIVSAGAYRWIRHPAYAGGMLIMIGIGMAMTNWVSVGVLALLPGIAYGCRVCTEERAMLATLGQRYVAYTRATKRFVPFLF